MSLRKIPCAKFLAAVEKTQQLQHPKNQVASFFSANSRFFTLGTIIAKSATVAGCANTDEETRLNRSLWGQVSNFGRVQKERRNASHAPAGFAGKWLCIKRR
jgi:hypothetical protein